MTIASAQSVATLQGNNVTTVFSFGFVGDSASVLQVLYTDADDTTITLSPSQYTLFLNPVAPGELWSVGGSCTFPLSGSPIAAGTSLTIQRILPLTQQISIQNQGSFAPVVTEQALDILEMQIQQVSSRTGLFRGTWTTNTAYNYGDFAVDGINGLNSGNYYLCINSNTSGIWATDLANGYWQLFITATIPVTPLPLSTANGGTGQTTAAAALTALGGVGLGSANVYTSSNDFTGGSALVTTQGAGDSSTKAASTAFVNGTALTLANGTTAVTQSQSDNSTKPATTAYVDTAVGNFTVAFNSIAGFLPSSIAGTSTTGSLSISAGQAADNTNVTYISKSTGTSWAVSNGNAINGYQGGTTLPNSSTIHFYACRGGSGTGTFASTSLTPTIPAGYSNYYRRIFSLKTTGAGALIPGTALEIAGGAQLFYLTTQVLDADVSNQGATAILYTLSLPTGVKFQPLVRISGNQGGGGVIIVTSGDETDVAPATGGIPPSAAPGDDLFGSSGNIQISPFLTTNTSAQIRARANTAGLLFNVVTRGWVDYRRAA